MIQEKEMTHANLMYAGTASAQPSALHLDPLVLLAGMSQHNTLT